jgi:flagellar motor protein MotB
LQAQGSDKDVVLRGTVDTEAIRAQKGVDAQAFFGSGVTIDNQIIVKAAEPVAVMPPPAAKLYFDTGKTALQSDADATLAPVIEWLKANPAAKAVVSGFHDPRGNQKVNEDLAYNRAKAVHAALITAGIDVMRIELRKPESVDGGGDLAEARRVEVSVE